MKQKEESLEEKIAIVQHISTDQGNGGSYCGNCSETIKKPYVDRECTKCGYTLDYLNSKPAKPYEFGGNDF